MQYEEQLHELLKNSRIVIDLSGRIILFTEPPDPELWQTIRSILSHDKSEINFPFYDSQIKANVNVVVRG